MYECETEAGKDHENRSNNTVHVVYMMYKSLGAMLKFSPGCFIYYNRTREKNECLQDGRLNKKLSTETFLSTFPSIFDWSPYTLLLCMRHIRPPHIKNKCYVSIFCCRKLVTAKCQMKS